MCNLFSKAVNLIKICSICFNTHFLRANDPAYLARLVRAVSTCPFLTPRQFQNVARSTAILVARSLAKTVGFVSTKRFILQGKINRPKFFQPTLFDRSQTSLQTAGLLAAFAAQLLIALLSVEFILVEHSKQITIGNTFEKIFFAKT